MTNRVRRSGPGVADLPTRTAAPLSSPPPPPPYAYVEETANGARRWTPAANVVAAPVVMPLPVPPPLPVTAAPPRTHFAQATPPPPQQQQQQRQQPASVPAARASDPRSTLFSGRFTLLDCLGSGGFGDVYRAEERDQGVPLAVKVEQVTETNSRPDQSFLFHEAKVLQDIHKSIQSRCAKLKSEREARLQRGGQRDEADDSPSAELNPDAVGITKLKYYGQDGMQRVLIMSLHGHSVESVHRRQGRLSLYATVIIADQVLSSLEHVHRAGYVHADLKPDNILFGRSDPEQLYLIDFGLSVRYRDREGKHRPLITNHSFVGTPRYASLRTHMGYTLSRRDDIEQLVYVMIYLFRGRLPWSGLRIDDPDRKEKHIAQMKANISLDAICAGCPEAFRDVLNYARCMSFEEDPEYEYLHLLLYSLREACTSGAGSEVLRIPAPPVKEAHQHQQQPPQQQAPRHAHVNAPVQAGKTRESAAAEGATSNFASHPNIVSNSGNDEEGGDANPLVSPREDGSPGLFSDAIGQGILSGNATDAGPLSPRIDCLDGGESPTCLPLGSPMPCALP